MTYKKYEIPSSAGIMWEAGAGFNTQTLPDNYRTTLDQAQRIQKVTGGTLVDASKDTSLSMRFTGLLDTDAWRPFYVKDMEFPGFVGPAAAIMNAKGINYPGEWVGVAGNRQWVNDDAAANPPAPATIPSTPNPNDAKVFMDPAGNMASQATDSQRIAHIESILIKAFLN